MKCKTESIVLRKFPYGESDLIITLFSKTHGKIKGFAKSGRVSKKRFNNSFQVGAQLQVMFNENPRSQMVSLLEAIPIKKYSSAFTLDSIANMMRILELADKFLAEGEASVEKYALMEKALDGITSNQFGKTDLLKFQFDWLIKCGFSPCFDSCVLCRIPLKSKAEWFFSSPLGGVTCSSCRTQEGSQLSSESVKLFTHIGREPFDCDDHLCAELDHLLSGYAEYVLGQELKARRLSNELI